MRVFFSLSVLAILLYSTSSPEDLYPPHNHASTVLLPLRVSRHQLHLLGSLHAVRAQELKINIKVRSCYLYQSIYDHTHHHLRDNPIEKDYQDKTMASLVSGTEFEHLDPSTLLSIPDVIQLLLKSCDKIVNENIKFEREYTKAIVDTEVNGIMKITELLAEHISSQNSKIADLEMKLDTRNNYQEELMCSLKRGLQDTFLSVGNDVRNIMSKLNSCEICEKTFNTFQQLLVHAVNEHVHDPQENPNDSMHLTNVEEQFATNQNESLILQVDGNDSEFLFSESDEESGAIPGQKQLPVTDSSSSNHPHLPSASHRTANFALNKAKQVQNLGADTNLDDFSVNVNDNDKNVNIQCSTAVYEAVVKPLFSNFTKGSNFKCNNISVSCSHVDYNRDKNCFEFNRVLHIILGGSGQFNIGKVTIHLHHTKRSIQMQGSALMPDGSRTPIWFLTHFLWDTLVSIAAEKRLDIAKIVRDAIENRTTENKTTENIANICQHFTRLFDTKSKPTPCNHCLCYFHKTSCLPAHSSSCVKKRNIVPTVASSNSSASDSSSRPSIAASKRRRITVTYGPPFQNPPSGTCQTSSPRPLDVNYSSAVQIQQNQDTRPSQARTPPVTPPARQSSELHCSDNTSSTYLRSSNTFKSSFPLCSSHFDSLA